MNFSKGFEMKTFYIVTVKVYKNGKFGRPMMATRNSDSFPTNLDSFPGRKKWAFESKDLASTFAKELIEKTKKVVEEKIPEVSPEIKKIVAELFEIQKSKVLEDLQDRYKKAIEKLKIIEGMNTQTEEYKKIMFFDFPGRCSERTFAGQLSGYVMRHKMNKDVNFGGSYHDPLWFEPNYEKIVKNKIENDLKAIMDSFLYKMEFKLGEVIKTKEIKKFTSKGLHDGFVTFFFKDGTCFHLKNSIEWGFSCQGKPFQRFPCRFHDVKFLDGHMESWVSEVNMKKNF